MSYIKKKTNIKKLKAIVETNAASDILEDSRIPITGTIIAYSPHSDAVNVCYNTQFYVDDEESEGSTTNSQGIWLTLMSGTFGDSIDNFSEVGPGYYWQKSEIYNNSCDLINITTYVPSWSGEKTLLLAGQSRSIHDNYNTKIHSTNYFSGSDEVRSVYPHVICYSITE